VNEQAQRTWKYTVNRQFGFRHYHVMLISDCHVWDVLGGRRWDIDYTGCIKFNTQAESEKFIARVRRALSRRGIKLRLLAKDLAI